MQSQKIGRVGPEPAKQVLVHMPDTRLRVWAFVKHGSQVIYIGPDRARLDHCVSQFCGWRSQEQWCGPWYETNAKQVNRTGVFKNTSGEHGPHDNGGTGQSLT